MAKQTQKSGKKNRKYGRNKAFCLLYRSRQQRERNKGKRLVRHLNRHPLDFSAMSSWDLLPVKFQRGFIPSTTALLVLKTIKKQGS